LIRAGALMRLARCYRKLGRSADAVAAYGSLAALGDAVVADAPAELIARRERIALFEANREKDAAAQERTLLARALTGHRFPIDRPTFEFFMQPLGVPSVESSAEGDTTLAEAVDAFWPAWNEQSSGRATWTGGAGRTFTAVWRTTPSGVAAIVGPLGELTAAMRDTVATLRVTVVLEDGRGAHAWGNVVGGPVVSKTSRETGLPWSLRVATDHGSTLPASDSRRNLLAAGFVFMAVVVSAAGYFVFRAVNRELGVARLQSDFVAAVSHEFRTPLTAMCHLTEMLEDGAVERERLPDYYRALGKESRRLHTMVESLLDFGRMDSGRRTYEFCETNALDLVDRVAQEFADRAPESAARISQPPRSSSGDESLLVRADADALALAIRNLLDNALKYSPEPSPVRLDVTRHNGSIEVSVVDRGGGITAQEREDIFRKFTRGAAARHFNVKGTGIGLTMVDQIVRAHGGRINLTSDPGHGSTFTIVLPAIAPSPATTESCRAS
jgi:two-component system, OmpR family, phosphate regulon sensor histidine kinase PhoR